MRFGMHTRGGCTPQNTQWKPLQQSVCAQGRAAYCSQATIHNVSLRMCSFPARLQEFVMGGHMALLFLYVLSLNFCTCAFCQ